MDWEALELGSGLGGALGGMFGGNPYKKEMEQMGNIPDVFKNALGPYMSEGKNLLGPLTNQFNQMMNDPGSILSRIGAGYKQSPGYQFQVNQGLAAANRALAPTGMGGTAANQVQLQQLGQHLADQDYGNYMNRALGMFQGGLGGLGGLERQGYGAAEDYAGGMGNYYRMMAELAGQQQQNKNSQLSGLGSLFGGAAGALASLF